MGNKFLRTKLCIGPQFRCFVVLFMSKVGRQPASVMCGLLLVMILLSLLHYVGDLGASSTKICQRTCFQLWSRPLRKFSQCSSFFLCPSFPSLSRSSSSTFSSWVPLSKLVILWQTDFFSLDMRQNPFPAFDLRCQGLFLRPPPKFFILDNAGRKTNLNP